MISLYRPGTGVLHRMPAGVKLAALATCALALSLVPLGVAGTAATLIAASALHPLSGLPLATLLEAWWRLRWLVVVLGGALWLFTSPAQAMTSTGRVVTLLLLASVVTATTRTGAILDVLTRALAPLRRLGVDPGPVALTVSLTIAMVPVVAGFADQVRDAQRARGARLGPRAALPLLVLTMRHADDVGDAIVARGIAR
ncbi:energy-coupling factor transporter transmembrane protein EcfT [Microbacterium sp.]|uniref:energy-coupling factor transporter transmembrane component T family protein n=1 Tax=Microbacterium sp. TaxID=51671 RepID=UPI002812705C|nr:energy-coupling factor transporter transmembrane protein EcfT [Microbacterium sp.]